MDRQAQNPKGQHLLLLHGNGEVLNVTKPLLPATAASLPRHWQSSQKDLAAACLDPEKVFPSQFGFGQALLMRNVARLRTSRTGVKDVRRSALIGVTGQQSPKLGLQLGIAALQGSVLVLPVRSGLFLGRATLSEAALDQGEHLLCI